MNCRKIGCGDTNIYRVGMICLKHRLTRSEVMEALSESPVKPIHNGYLDYQTSIGHLLTFKFDASGNLLLVRTHERFEFPSLESVLPDTPIDPPMIPKVEKRLDLEN